MVTSLLAVALALFGQTAPPSEEISAALSELSKVTGFRALKRVHYDTIDKTRLKQFLEERVRKEVKPEEIRAEELALKKFGLAPPEFNLARTTVDLLTEQAAAFYDYRKKKLFLMEGPDGALGQDTILVHELAHALADQHFDLGKFLRRGKTDDAALARMAVMEGQATWLMYEFFAQKMGQSLKTSPHLVEAMSRGSDGLNSQYPVLAAAPLYLKMSLLFPYTQGMRFQQAVLARFGDAGFARVFREPPASTQQVLHPDLYVSRIDPVLPGLPPVPRRKDWRTLTDGTVGEFDHAILLEEYGGREQAQELAPSWRGGVLEILEHKRDKRSALVYASTWADEASAKKMFQAYRLVLKGKWKNLNIHSESASCVQGTGDDGFFRVSVAGTQLRSLEGMASAAEAGTCSPEQPGAVPAPVTIN